jgi:hypothetical protein
MRGIAGKFKHGGGSVPAVLALLLLFRLLIPSGYMIAPDHEGKPGLVLCAAPAGAAAEPERDGGHEGHPADPAPSGPAETPCAFAALAAPPIPPEPPALAPQAAAAAAPSDLPASADLPRVARASPPPPARGPPIPV